MSRNDTPLATVLVPVLLVALMLGSGCGDPPPPDRLKLHSGTVLEGRVVTDRIEIKSELSGGMLERTIKLPTAYCKSMSFPDSGRIRATLMSTSWKRDKKGRRVGDGPVHETEEGRIQIYSIQFKTLEGDVRKIPTGDIQWIKFGRGYPPKPEGAAEE